MSFEVAHAVAPAAHAILVGTVLIDAGDGSAAVTRRILDLVGRRPVELIACTHGHQDHVGGAGALREALGAPVALHRADEDRVVTEARRLGQPAEALRVDRYLAEGDELPGGLRVVEAASQTPGHVVLWSPTERAAFTGDLLQADDVAWIPFADGALEQAIEAIERIAALHPAVVVPGHGPPVTDVQRRAAETIAQYTRWREQPARRARHLARRVIAFWVVLQPDAPSLDDAVGLLEDVAIIREVAAVCQTSPARLASGTLDELLGSGALALRGGRLVACFPTERDAGVGGA